MHSVRRVPCPLPAILANFCCRRNLRGPSMRWVVGITIGGSSWRRIDVSGPGGKTRKAGRGNVRRLRAARRPLHFRLRSTELVHDVYLRERSIRPRYRSGAASSQAAYASPRTAENLKEAGSLSTPVRG